MKQNLMERCKEKDNSLENECQEYWKNRTHLNAEVEVNNGKYSTVYRR